MAGLQIPNPSITSAAFAAMLAFSSDNNTITAISGHPIAGVGGGGTPVEGYWRPALNTDGDISWVWSLESTSTVPSTANIKGPQGIQGETGPQGPSGTNGKDGQDGAPGIDGISPTFTTSVTSDEQHPQGGTRVVISGAAGESTFNVWNGVDGEGATVNLIEGDGIQITHNAGTTNYTIGVSADYATKTYVDTASAEALSQAKSWTNQQNFATSAGLDDNKQFAMTTTGWKEVAVPSVPDITATNGISANGHNIGLTTDVYSAIQEISAANDLVGANGISVVAGANNQVIIAPSGISPSKQYAMTMTGWEEVQAGTTETAYVPLSGGTMSGQLTISGDSFNNNLHLKRGNNEGFIGLAGNGAITLKNSTNGSTSQIEFLTSDNKTFDITVKDNSTTPQPVGKLYVMSAHSLADATATSANWANDGMLHIILDS